MSHTAVNAGGQLITGTSRSFTVMSCVHVAVFPHRSSTWYVRVYTFGQFPAVEVSLNKIKLVGSIPQLSVAVPAAAVNAAYTAYAGCSGMSHTAHNARGQLITGTSRPFTMMSRPQVAAFSHRSTTLHSRVYTFG